MRLQLAVVQSEHVMTYTGIFHTQITQCGLREASEVSDTG